jgi:RimJ/RimL family protein N-acetyltransferase
MESLHRHTLRFRQMTEKNARAIIAWRYEAPYDVYNIAAPGADVIQEYLLPENAYYSIHDTGDNLVGYCCFGQDARVPGGVYQDNALDVGLGLRPDLTGNSNGSEFVRAILDFGLKQYAPQAFRLTVAAFNERAIRVYQKLGFTPVAEFTRSRDGEPFIVMLGREKRTSHQERF